LLHLNVLSSRPQLLYESQKINRNKLNNAAIRSNYCMVKSLFHSNSFSFNKVAIIIHHHK